MNDDVGSRPAPDGGPDRPLAGVDPAVLHQLDDLMEAGFAREVAALYQVTAVDKVAAIARATAANAPEHVLGAAHSLASCAGAVGATEVEACARAIESEAAAARLPGGVALAALEQALADSLRAIEVVLGALAAGPEDAVDNGAPVADVAGAETATAVLPGP